MKKPSAVPGSLMEVHGGDIEPRAEIGDGWEGMKAEESEWTGVYQALGSSVLGIQC